MIIKRFDKIPISAMTFFVIEFIIPSIVILFVFKLVIIVIVIAIIIIIVVISFIVIVIKIIIVLIIFVKKLIALRFDMIMFFAINAIFNKFLNDLVIKIKYNVFLKFNNNDMF